MIDGNCFFWLFGHMEGEKYILPLTCGIKSNSTVGFSITYDEKSKLPIGAPLLTPIAVAKRDA